MEVDTAASPDLPGLEALTSRQPLWRRRSSRFWRSVRAELPSAGFPEPLSERPRRPDERLYTCRGDYKLKHLRRVERTGAKRMNQPSRHGARLPDDNLPPVSTSCS